MSDWDWKAQMEWADAIRRDYDGYVTKSPECNPGWDALLREFFDAVKRLMPNPNHFHLGQIKEKWGGLRIYYSLENVADEVHGEIDRVYDDVSERSYRTCEITGKPGKLVNRKGAVMVRCEELAQQGDVELPAPTKIRVSATKAL